MLRRRADDPEMADHSKERDLSDLVPKWALVRLLSISVTVGCALGSGSFWLWRLNQQIERDSLERQINDPWKAKLAEVSETASKALSKSEQIDSRVTVLEQENLGRKMDRLSAQFEELNRRMTRAFGR